MPIRAITFDCAQTLVDVCWDPADCACEIAGSLGIQVSGSARADYQNLLLSRFSEFLKVNRTRSEEALREFHLTLNRDWLRQLGEVEERADELTTEMEREVFSPRSRYFRVFPDTLEALLELKETGYRLAVISNWDLSLHRILVALNIAPYLEFSLASLEEGVEKPNPLLFQLALQRLSLEPHEVLHIGDDLVDDGEGAFNAGIGFSILRRDAGKMIPNQIQSLTEIGEVIQWLS